MKKEIYNQEVSDAIYKICKPNFEKVLQETLPDSMTTPKKPIKLLIRFNNYRRQQQIKVYKDSTIQKIKSAIPCNYIERTKLLFVSEYKPQITLMVGKNTITGIWSQKIINGEKQAYVLEADNLEEVDKWFNEKKEWIEGSIDIAIKEFITAFNFELEGKFNPIEKRKEIEVKGEEYIDNLPEELILHDTVGKKVYSSGFEFKNEIYAKNYIKSRAIEDISPQIQEQLILIQAKMDLLDKRQETLTQAMDYYDKNIIKHFEILNKMSDTLSKLEEGLNKKNFFQKLFKF
jgi:hypothetical protein